jgi:protein-S-isoprenylcysteine O-methyltransferase Ste14
VDRLRRTRDFKRSWRWGNVPLPEPYLVGLALAIALERRRPWVLRGHGAMLGLLFLSAGAGLVVRSVRAAALVDVTQPDRLVTQGPYAYTRNPMYLGWALVHLGVAVIRRSGWSVAALPAAAVWVHRQVIVEERELAKVFGDVYTSYRERVPRYLFARSR